MSTEDYRITVRIEDWDSCTKEERAAHVHANVTIEFTVAPTATFTREELLAIYRWYAGVVARLAVLLDSRITRHYRYANPPTHRCLEDRDGEVCGLSWDEGIACPGWCLAHEDNTPTVSLTVPTKHVRGWVKDFKQVIAWMLTGDLEPVDPEPQPEEHTAGPLPLSTATTSEERTR